jgi:NADH-quinone oxidoreductase subunit I
MATSMGDEIRGVWAMVKGMGMTFRFMFRPNLTVEYPEKKRPDVARLRWRHRLHRYANGLERCIGCSLCAAACPARAIFVEPAENTAADRHSPGERYAKRYEINLLRCIFCGYCEEACPTQAIVLSKDYELTNYSRESLIYTKERLLVSEGMGLPPTVGSLPPLQMELK